MNYNKRKDEKKSYLRNEARMGLSDIASMQFSQEADPGNKAAYEITLERCSTTDDV